ncbi:MAG: DUF6765 family protein [Candidatus Latescibacterota bacterium]
MQCDFHYYGVAVLARAAGFPADDALTIAYASQYVDDSTEGELIPIQTRGAALRLDPVRTAYTLPEAIRQGGWPAQKRVWIPFHFVPPRPFDPDTADSFSFVTEAGSPFARLLLAEAARELPAHPARRLCRLGVALHAYADSWSHHGFSGRRSRTENDVTGIHLRDRESGQWAHPGIENLLLDAAPEIGHAEAGFFPDLACLEWRCTLKRSGKEMQRDNTVEFLAAAADIHLHLQAIPKLHAAPIIPWSELEPGLQRLLSDRGQGPELVERLSPTSYRQYHARELARRCAAWRSQFGALFGPRQADFAYDRRQWREEALEGDVDWDDYREDDWLQMPPRPAREGFWDSLWVHFHRAALRQRHLVLENVP